VTGIARNAQGRKNLTIQYHHSSNTLPTRTIDFVWFPPKTD
jgi:hypothetical protein